MQADAHLTVLTIPKRLLSMPPALLLGCLLEVEEEEEDKVGEGCDSFNTSQWGPWIWHCKYFQSEDFTYYSSSVINS